MAKRNKKNQKRNKKIIFIIVGILLILLISMVGIMHYQNQRKKNLMQQYIAGCEEKLFDGHEFCECVGYHIKYLLGEKEAYKYFDMSLSKSPEALAYIQTKGISSKLNDYCLKTESLTDNFLNYSLMISQSGLSNNKALCYAYHVLLVLGRERFLRFIYLDKANFTKQQWLNLGYTYNLNEVYRKISKCNDNFSFQDMSADNEDIREIKEKWSAKMMKDSKQKNKVEPLIFDDTPYKTLKQEQKTVDDLVKLGCLSAEDIAIFISSPDFSFDGKSIENLLPDILKKYHDKQSSCPLVKEQDVLMHLGILKLDNK